MPRTTKEPQKSSPPKAAPVEKNHEPKASEPPQALLQAARGDLMRAQRDLESVRLELVEQKRRSAQHALVHAAELKEARSERDQLRMQLDALRGELALRGEPAAAAKKKKREPQEDARIAALEEELESARGELSEARASLSEARASLAKLQAEQAETEAAVAKARNDLVERSRAPTVVAASAAVEPPAAAAQPRGFFSKLFGRRPPADAR